MTGKVDLSRAEHLSEGTNVRSGEGVGGVFPSCRWGSGGPPPRSFFLAYFYL